MNKSKIKRISIVGMLTALYFVLSALLKIPIAGHITLDLGYIALMVAAVLFGAGSAMTVGGIGAFLESLLMSSRGISPGWILMNIIAGGITGFVLKMISGSSRKKYIICAVISVVLSMALGAAVKMLIDCALYDLPIIAKIPTTLVAWISDSIVMLIFGLPISIILQKRFKI